MASGAETTSPLPPAAALLEHLEGEARCMRELSAVLGAEGAALRCLDRLSLVQLAEHKLRLTDEHASLARARAMLLEHLVPGACRLGQVLDATGELRAPLLAVQAELRSLAYEVMMAHRRNSAFAETGHTLINDSLENVMRRVGQVENTYRRNGRIDPSSAKAGALVRVRL